MASRGARLSCPRCGADLVELGDRLLLRTSILKVDPGSGEVSIRCSGRGCKQDVTVPWISADTAAITRARTGRRVVVRARGKRSGS